MELVELVEVELVAEEVILQLEQVEGHLWLYLFQFQVLAVVQ